MIKKTLFAEGDVVTEGQPLLVINPDAYKAQLDEAVNTLAKDRATAAQNRRDWLRYKDLVARAWSARTITNRNAPPTNRPPSRSGWTRPAWSTPRSAWTIVTSTRPAPVWSACNPTRPQSLEANKDVIVTVNQIEPVNVQFAVAEKYLPELRDYAAKGSLVVEASYPNHPDKVSKGKLSVINNTVDTTTGTIVLQGEFPNKDHLLWPGQFVNATVVLTMTADTLLVPSSALVTTQDGSALFVAQADNTVEMRKVEAGRKVGTFTVVDKGLKAGEKVITSARSSFCPECPSRSWIRRPMTTSRFTGGRGHGQRGQNHREAQGN